MTNRQNDQLTKWPDDKLMFQEIGQKTKVMCELVKFGVGQNVFGDLIRSLSSWLFSRQGGYSWGYYSLTRWSSTTPSYQIMSLADFVVNFEIWQTQNFMNSKFNKLKIWSTQKSTNSNLDKFNKLKIIWQTQNNLTNSIWNKLKIQQPQNLMNSKINKLKIG